ncbi:UV DNA damage repair endonuclease UvsE [Pisciglobus halotolerans]|uniref:UV-damage endonuclease n=1 Tax=Pisciglobus halotolerans TaxID=745365 RepID=A0A1I3AQT3_9LACT|nr:UV DNA damage repair endonuclease UvsE [Pisciglobus halotolerans]SFH52089.1 UV-damage endonuclease [Pisciglobus halotolerans]
MSIGYACLTVGVPETDMRRVTKKNATAEKLNDITRHNLMSLEKMIDYNIENDIHLFRISSDLIPFGSSPVNQLPWQETFREEFGRIGRKITESNMRVSFHPGQYTVLNSPNEETVAKAVEDLRYHNKVMECLGVNDEHKIVLHIGGVYEDKPAASQRFVENFQKLDQAIQRRLIIENDDRLYTIQDVLEIAEKIGIPVIYDNLHHAVNPGPDEGSDAEWIAKANQTWKAGDGKQKIHYSQQALDKRAGAHTSTIYLDTFLDFYDSLPDQDIDIMLEVKDKNLSAVKCINATRPFPAIKYLEKEWMRYKYLVLEHSPERYQHIRSLLKDKTIYPAKAFYHLIEAALDTEVQIGQAINAAQHVWGHLKQQVTEKEAKAFERLLAKYQEGQSSEQAVKKRLLTFAMKYHEPYLLQSLYVYI